MFAFFGIFAMHIRLSYQILKANIYNWPRPGLLYERLFAFNQFYIGCKGNSADLNRSTRAFLY
jgi:hypothetical protein